MDEAEDLRRNAEAFHAAAKTLAGAANYAQSVERLRKVVRAKMVERYKEGR